MQEVIFETLIDSLKLAPFLLLTYIIMEYLEHKTGEHTQKIVGRAGKWGPVLGAAAGAVPQCGFSAAASNLFAGRVITLGTLMAIFLSTSDEMLPILISEKVGIGVILKILGMKMAIGMAAGFLIDLLSGKHGQEIHIHDMCGHDHCHCEKGILRTALSHTLKILFFILLISFILNTALHFVGREALSGLILNRPVLGPMAAALVGLIPNCAASVVITQLYLEGAMGLGAMMAGLLTGAGVGILVLCRVNHHKMENAKIIGLLYLVGVLSGIVIEWLRIGL